MKNFLDIDSLGYIRIAIIIALAVTGYSLLLRWQADYVTVSQETFPVEPDELSHRLVPEQQNSDTPLPVIIEQQDTFQAGEEFASELPKIVNLSNETGKAEPVEIQATDTAHEIVTVKTDVLTAHIQLKGADLYKVSLNQYPKQLDSSEGFDLLSSSSRRYILQSGVMGETSNKDLDQKGRPLYQTPQPHYELGDKNKLVIPFIFENKDLKAVKSYIFERGSYQPRVRILVTNKSDTTPWSGVFFSQILRDGSDDPSAGTGGFGLPTFNGAAYWSPEKRYNKLDFDDLSEEGLNTSHVGGWVAWVQHYFLSAWILDPENKYHFSSRKIQSPLGENNDLYAISATQVNRTTVSPGQTQVFTSDLYLGPKIEKELATVAEGLNLAVDYGFLFMISKLLFQLLSFIHDYVGNWGIAIILLTVFVKAIFLWPSAISYRSMARMRKLAPELGRLKERFGDDRQRMSQEMMKIYRKEKVNPFGGCLPVLLQMPVFFALYWTLLESVELRQAPFFAWIQDLSAMDPYFILPLLMGVSMYIQTSLNPVPPDPTQAKVMKLMPIMFTVFFLFFPAGLVLYWLTNNILSIAQQWYITKQVEA